eukprot:TRINITY_DN67078_c3_g4_i1.p1 TRINITY_DN67078_c3_g4~~TRINITY_DN67078_c3_g4_i1.p1  ORF type:complete len:383 (+),score=159.41 TRINITY_DN67078_c3_g4_i1:111-1259(+)
MSEDDLCPWSAGCHDCMDNICQYCYGDDGHEFCFSDGHLPPNITACVGRQLDWDPSGSSCIPGGGAVAAMWIVLILYLGAFAGIGYKKYRDQVLRGRATHRKDLFDEAVAEQCMNCDHPRHCRRGTCDAIDDKITHKAECTCCQCECPTCERKKWFNQMERWWWVFKVPLFIVGFSIMIYGSVIGFGNGTAWGVICMLIAVLVRRYPGYCYKPKWGSNSTDSDSDSDNEFGRTSGAGGGYGYTRQYDSDDLGSASFDTTSNNNTATATSTAYNPPTTLAINTGSGHVQFTVGGAGSGITFNQQTGVQFPAGFPFHNVAGGMFASSGFGNASAQSSSSSSSSSAAQPNAEDSFKDVAVRCSDCGQLIPKDADCCLVCGADVPE